MSSKGKQATKGQKQIHDENVASLTFYLQMSIVGAVLHFAINYLLFRETTSLKSWVMFVISVGCEVGALQMMRSMSKASFGPTGQIIDAGLDVNVPGGVGEYCKDVIILSTMVQVLSIISAYFWLLFLLGPVYAIYVLWTNILAPWFFARAPEGDADAEEKKRRKKERKVIRMRQ